MILPLRTSIEPQRTPYANYFFIAANVVVFLLTYSFGAGQNKPVANAFMLWPGHPELWQFVSYAFLHGNIWHIVGNMFFLYLFGNNVNDKFGNIGYCCFYLGGAVYAAIGHLLLHSGANIPILGASGAVAAVTGAYLVLFPKTLITIIYMFIFIGTWDIPAIYFIGFKMIILDNVIARNTPNVAYDAHLAGYTYGILCSILLLATRLMSGTGLDLWTMLKQWNRRRSFRDSVASGYQPFESDSNVKQVSAREVPKPPTAAQQRLIDLRAKISDDLAKGNASGAMQSYLDLIGIDSKQVLPRQQLLDIANHLMSSSQWPQAAQAYETFLVYYKTYEYAEQVQLMLGLLYARYLGNKDEARLHLEKALGRLHDPNQITMCKGELERLGQ